MNELSVAVIVSARNAEKTIDKCINSLLGLNYSNYRIIIIDDFSADRTSEILKRYQGKIELIFNTTALGPPKVRNMAAQRSKSEYLAFIDSDCIADADWLKELSRGFMGPDIVSVGGIQGIPPDESKFGRRVSLLLCKAGFCSDYMRNKGNRIVSVSNNPSCNVMYRKDVFLGEGGFSEDLWPGEDVELDCRLKKKGYKIIFNPKAMVYHYRVGNLKAFSRMMYRYGLCHGFLFRRYGIFRRVQLLALILSVLVISFPVGLFYSWKAVGLVTFLMLLGSFVYLSLDLSLLILALYGMIIWYSGFIGGAAGYNQLK